ncbi:nucleoside hydrolase [Branchiibius sp. NY16-3462-2]|uniref:nucleoside hydrolase n=1 Tax=Branchiibius sp. NY16-3462-2 TaxID=1807500 RepID=UPI0007942E3E|nr:nucleoside hydrolase [Branchiibius sp. NY16-3462-2]KYH45683.1 hypothetical protein AZH51_18400 [Branchiibius sp. NY16-3462-2]
MGSQCGEGDWLLSAPLVVDTDLGSDPDDELALAFVWGSSEFDLRQLIVSYGDVQVRASIAQRMAALTGHSLRVAVGQDRPLSDAPVWWSGQEGSAYGELAPPAELEPVDLGLASGGILLGIAPLTTIAAGFAAAPTVPPALDRLVVMGGDFRRHAAPEHNVVSDVDAAQAVFDSDATILAIGLDVTRQVRLYAGELRQVAAAGPLGAILGREIDGWLARWDEDYEVPHDPVTALAYLEPELFEFSRPGRVVVSDDGATRFAPGEGRTSIATAVNAEVAARSVVRRVLRGLSVQATDA